MKKETFKYLYSFKYKNKEYIYLISKNYPFYFLEYNPITNNFDYPDIIVFKDLYNKFYSNENIYSFNIKSEQQIIKEILNNIKINITPLVKTKNGLMTLIMILSLCGCAQTANITSNQGISETEIDNYNQQTTSTESTSEKKYDNKNQEIINYFQKYNIDVTNRDYDGNDYIFVKQFINSKNQNQITLNTFEEFRKYQHLDFTPTYDDVITAFKENTNIDDEKRNIILECLNNMKNTNELKEMDLSVLYVNAKRMKINYLSEEEIVNEVNRNSVYAFFDASSGILYLPKDKPLKTFEFIHEVLGHGSLSFRNESESNLTVFDCTNYLMLPTEDRYTGYSIGTMINEGGANMIAHFATKDYSVSNFYELYEEELRVIANLCNISIGELFNHKGIDFYDLMYRNGISTPVEYIFKMDGIYKGQLYCEFSDLMERLLIDATDEKIAKASNEQKKEIINQTINIIRNSYFKNKDELSFDYSGGEIKYNFDSVADNYEYSMNQFINKQ